MAGQLFLRSYERSDRIYNAMLSRGYKGELMTIHPHHFHRSDLITGGLSILALVLMQIAGRL
jgi:cobalt/nickel transport system permease protein